YNHWYACGSGGTADAHGLGPCAARRESSNLSFRTRWASLGSPYPPERGLSVKPNGGCGEGVGGVAQLPRSVIGQDPPLDRLGHAVVLVVGNHRGRNVPNGLDGVAHGDA